MKVNTSNDAVVERSGLASDGAYGIIFNAKMAKILSDGLYSDKIQSIIRELSCNAVDSHVEAGKPDHPIEVHLPTWVEPWFHVRDFGIGLDHMQVVEIYTIYGASTKIHSNDLIGQLGLGSKSPFSYVDAYDVTAIKDGIERQYSMYKNEQGMPSVALLGEKPTKEPNGVTVKMPVRQDDMRRFAEKAAQVFRWFAVRPNVVGVSGFTIPDLNPVFEGKGWRILKKEDNYYHSDRNRPVALMGRVAYPLDRNAINGLTKAQQAILETPLVIDFPIGDLEIAASREALGYDDRTQSNIRDRLALVLSELAAVFEQKMAAADTEWEARRIFGTIFGNESGFRWEFEKAFGNHGLKWKNKVIKDGHVTLKTPDLWDEKTESPNIYTNGTRYKRARRQTYHTDITIRCADRVMFVFDDLEKGGLSRVNYLIEQKGHGQEIYFIGESTKKTRDEILDVLGNPPYQLTSSLPKRPSAARTKISMQRYKGSGKGTRAWEPVDMDLEDGGIYVVLDHWNVMHWDGENTTDSFERVVELSRELGILGKDDVIYAPRGHLRKKVQDSGEWTSLWEMVRESLDARLTPKVLQTVADAMHFSQVSATIKDKGLWMHPWKLEHQDGALARFSAAMRQLEAISRSSSKDQLLIDLAKIMDGSVKSVAPSINASTIHKEVMSSYPMLSLLLDTAHYGYGSRFDGKNIARTVQDYVNQCDGLRKQALEAGFNSLIAA